MSSRYGARVERSYVQHIQASPESVFPLLCPVREADWLDGWRYKMIHSESGVAEDGCVFSTETAVSPETIWTVTKHDRVAGEIEFVRVTAEILATRLRIRLEPAPGNATSVHIRYTHTPIGPAGVDFIEKHHSPEAFAQSMSWWEKSMNHYLETGKLLRAES